MSDLEIEDFDLSSLSAVVAEFEAENPTRQQLAIILPELVPAGTSATFRYEDLTPAIAEQARTTAERIQGRLRTSYIETGADLLKIKDKLEFGLFGKWLRAEFGWSPRTAENFMNAARLYEIDETVSDLPATAVYKLSAPSTPARVRDEIIADFKAGQVFDAKVMLNKIDIARYEDRIAKVKSDREAADAAKEAKSIEGKTPAKIKARRKRKAEREAAIKVAEKERERQLKAREKAGADAVDMLVDALGGKLAAFVELHEAAVYEFSRALRTRVGGSI